MAKRYYPVGIQDFGTIREKNAVYVDKTALIYQLNKEGKVYFLSRPRRFGKSLLISTMEAYFQGRKKLFAGLEIENLETEWVEYPVLRIDLSKTAYRSLEDLEEVFERILSPYETVYGTNPKITKPGGRLESIIQRAYKQTGKKVVVLVDEYDAPLLDSLDKPELNDVLRDEMRAFYKPLKANDSMLQFVFLTGITKFSQLSIFSALNNLDDISMDDSYAAICGITERELYTQMAQDIELLALAQNQAVEECKADLKRHYDGYHLSPQLLDIYNPFSLLIAFKKGVLGNYWFESATPSYLIKIIQQYAFEPSDMERVRAQKETFDAPTNSPESAIPILYQTGYLTIKSCERDENRRFWYTLGIPNNEVRDSYYKALMRYYVPGSDVGKDAFIYELQKAVRATNIERIMALIKAFIASIPYDAEKRDERHYRTLFYLVFRLLTTVDIRVEERTSAGRSDAVIQTKKAVLVFEFKLPKSNHPTAALEALLQINERGYAIPYQADGRPVYKIGAAFDESIGTLGEYVVEIL